MRCTRGHGNFVRSPFKPELRRGLWSPDEDNMLFNYIVKNGIQGCTWSYIAKQAGLQRCGKSCRLRWFNYLRPGLKHGAISPQEEQLIIDLHSIIGNRWCQIAACLPGRTDSEIKNYWNSSIKKRLNLKQNPSSNSTKSDIPFRFDTTCVANPVSLHPRVLSHDAYSYSQSAQPLHIMPRGYQLRQNYKTLDVAATAVNQHSFAPDILESKHKVEDQNHQLSIDQDLTNNQLISYSTSTHTGRKTFYDAFTCPNLQAQDDTHKTEKPFSCHQLLSTPPPHEASVSANNSVSCTVNSTIPPLIEISDSLVGKTENDGEIIWENKNENEIMFDYSSSASSCGIAAWRANSYSNTTDFIDEASQREKSSSQFSPPLAMVWADLDQYSNVQAEDDNVPSYINSHSGQSISCQAGGAQDGDQYPSTFGIECEGEAGEDTIWVDDLYNIFHTDIAAFSSR